MRWVASWIRSRPELTEFLEAQPVFFVATAPASTDHHVNVSPKGLDSFRVLDEHTVAYLDLHGSGIETVAHVRGERPDHADVLRVLRPARRSSGCRAAAP